MSFSVIHCLPAFFHTLLHRLVLDPLQYRPAVFCSVIVLIFSRLDSTHVHFWSVYWLSSITHAQAILIASVCSVGHWYLLADRFICDAVFIRNPHNSSEPAIFTGIKLILHVFGETPWLTSACEYWENKLSNSLSFNKSRLTACRLKIHLQDRSIVLY